jgi:hypothetical protein
MSEQWKPTGEKLPTGEVPKESMAVAPEVAKRREEEFAAKRAKVLGQDERLREAARSGDVALIESWPPGDAAINKPGQGGWTALHFAAREGGVVVRCCRRRAADCSPSARLVCAPISSPLTCPTIVRHAM